MIKVGNIFRVRIKIYRFNEYFDTQVDNKIIAEGSLNGIFIKKHLDIPVLELDKHIKSYPFDCNEKFGNNAGRKIGKKFRYQIGTICVYKEFLLTAFTSSTMTTKPYLQCRILGVLNKFLG